MATLFPFTRRRHDAPGGWAKAEGRAGEQACASGPKRSNPLRPVERREAQRLGGRASQTLRSSPARSLGTGLANPSERGLAKPVLARRVGASEEMPGTMRGLANPWRLPALHSLRGRRKKGTGGARAEQNNRAAQRWLTSQRFRDAPPGSRFA